MSVPVGGEHWPGAAGKLETCVVGECHVCAHTINLLSLAAQEEEETGFSVLI